MNALILQEELRLRTAWQKRGIVESKDDGAADDADAVTTTGESQEIQWLQRTRLEVLHTLDVAVSAWKAATQASTPFSRNRTSAKATGRPAPPAAHTDSSAGEPTYRNRSTRRGLGLPPGAVTPENAHVEGSVERRRGQRSMAAMSWWVRLVELLRRPRWAWMASGFLVSMFLWFASRRRTLGMKPARLRSWLSGVWGIVAVRYVDQAARTWELACPGPRT